MGYQPRTWRDDPEGRTPIEAVYFNNLEQGLAEASAQADRAFAASQGLLEVAGIKNNTTVMVNRSQITQSGDGWSSLIPFNTNSNPGTQVVHEGSNNLFRLQEPGLYLWAIRATLTATPSSTAFIDHYRYTSVAGAGVSIQSRTSGYQTNWISGSAVLSMGGNGSWYNIGVRAIGGFTINAGQLVMTLTRLT